MLSDKFWMVICLDQEYTDERGNYRFHPHQTPTFQHAYRDQAETEALRLAKKFKRSYAVLETVSQTKPMPVPGEFKMADMA